MESEFPVTYNITTGSTPDPYTPLISDATLELIFYISYTCISAVIAYFSMCGNFLALVTFFKIGFQETINISLANFVMCDFMRVTLMSICRFSDIIHYFDLVLEFDWLTINMYFLGILLGIFGYLSGTLAGYIALERCLCVSFPFTVKYLITRRFVLGVNITLSLIVFGSFMPYYANTKAVYVIHPILNETVIMFQLKVVRGVLDDLLNVSGMLWQGLPFCVICVCTIVIFYHLRKFSKFRSQVMVTGKTSDGSSKGGMNLRDQKVMKMLLVIIVVYLVTTLPRVVTFLSRAVHPEMDVGGREHNLLQALFYLAAIFDSLNTFANPFIFFFMSTQYKEMFIKLFKPKCL